MVKAKTRARKKPEPEPIVEVVNVEPEHEVQVQRVQELNSQENGEELKKVHEKILIRNSSAIQLPIFKKSKREPKTKVNRSKQATIKVDNVKRKINFGDKQIIEGVKPKQRKMWNSIPLNKRAVKKKFNKVFCIGLNKTGTTSIHFAFQKLGLRSFHGGTFDSRIDAFSDGRYYRHFKELDHLAPNSKFILNTRDLRGWVESRIKHCLNNHTNPGWEGTRVDEDIIRGWIKEREMHHAQIYDYFADRPDDLLDFDVCGGDGYNKLSKFLDLPCVGTPFPRENSSKMELPLKYKNMVERVLNSEN